MDYFAKKQWIRIAVCAVLVIAAVLAMTGVFSGNGPLMYDPAAKNLPAGAVTAEATEQGFGGDVTVSVTLDGSTVQDLTINTPNETEGLGKRASEAEFAEQFIGKEGPFTYGENGIEALSGATVTSNAALKAINRAITGEDAAEPEAEPAEEPAVEPAEESAEEPAADASAINVTEQGFGGDVTVHVTLDEDKVQALTIDTPNETAGLGQRASEEAFTSQFIGKSGPFTYGEDGIEALSGATVTSNAVLKAINSAVGGEEAPAEESAAEPAEEPAQSEEKEKTEETESNGQTYSVYRATKQNDFSTITVTASAKNGELTDVKITSEGEDGKDLLTEEIRGEWAKAILESGSAAPDEITGATLKFSAGSVQEAMTEILENMNSSDWNSRVTTAEGPAQKPVTEPAEEPAQEPAAEPVEEPAEESKEEPAADASAIDVTEQGFGGDVTVHVTLEGDKVQALTIDTPNETAGLGQRASEEAFTSQFIGKSGPFTFGEDGIEALSGATVTSNAVLKAINSVAAGETAEEPANAPAEEKEETPAEPAEEPVQPEETEKTEEAGSNSQAYGVYRSTKQNDFSTVTVTASAKNGKLTDVKITSEGEEGKDLLTDEIRSEWAKAVLESGSTSPDAITGATLKFSAGSVQEAMAEILANMSGESAETPAEPEAEAETPAEPAEEPAQPEEKNKEAGSDGQAYGVYRATKQNDFSTVTVTVSAKNGKLTDVKITSEGEEGKDLLTDEIRSEWAKAILESGSASPDAITGATLKFSAGSVQEAMAEILANMSGEAAEGTEESAEETAAEETDEQAAGQEDVQTLITLSMGKEQENSYVTDYLEQDPYLVNIYEGYGFAKDYGSARGHYYTLTDVEKTQRPHAKANCLTCKTPDMHKMIEEQGVSVYSMPFDEVMAQMTQPISCYTCHGADDGNGGQMVVTHQYVNEALGENVSGVKAASLSCGQCHIEYYFTPVDSEAMMPYHSVAEMTPEAILAYYDELGFYDWEQPGTGTKMLKAQHPELETYSYGKHAAMLSCADCHMPVEVTESGTQYHDHHLVSPLTSDTLLAKCVACHGSAENTIALVQGIQEKVTARETEVGNKLSALKDELTEAVTAGKMNEEELDAVRKLHREAQWYFDFCYVENAEGAHNSELAYRCLDTSESKIGEAMNMLAAAGTADISAEAPAEEPAAEEAPAEEPAEEEAPAEEPSAEETPKIPPAYAGYRVTRENQFSRITVVAYAKSGKLISVKILSEGEDGKDLLTDAIREEWAKAILESGSASPDAVTGATLTFSAGSVQEAMTEILDKVAGR